MELQLDAKFRATAGKGFSRKLRQNGRVPAVLYAPQRETTPISVDAHETEMLITKGASRKILDLIVEKDGTTAESQVMFKDIQRDAVTGNLVHIDFYEIKTGVKISVEVPVRIIGEAVGVTDQGGVLQFMARRLDIECLPKDMPEYLDVDVSSLEVGHSVAVRDLMETQDSTITFISDPETVIASVIVVKAKAEDEDAGEGEGLGDGADALGDETKEEQD